METTTNEETTGKGGSVGRESRTREAPVAPDEVRAYLVRPGEDGVLGYTRLEPKQEERTLRNWNTEKLAADRAMIVVGSERVVLDSIPARQLTVAECVEAVEAAMARMGIKTYETLRRYALAGPRRSE